MTNIDEKALEAANYHVKIHGQWFVAKWNPSALVKAIPGWWYIAGYRRTLFHGEIECVGDRIPSPDESVAALPPDPRIAELEAELGETNRIIAGRLKYLSIDEAKECPGPLDCSLSYKGMIDDKKRLEQTVIALESQVARLRTAQEVGAEIIQIMETYDRQEAEGCVDTPGGLEHMGDVWRLLDWWRVLLKANEAIGLNPKGEKL